MKIIELKYKSSTFPLSKKFTNSFQSFTNKEIIILKAKDEKGNIAFGEVAPLPRFSKENISDCKNRLDKFSISTIKNFDNPEKLNSELKNFDDIPSLKFGVEQVIVGLMLKNKLNYFNIESHKKTIKVNGSIGIESLAETELQVQKFLKNAISTIKLKIGRKYFQEDLSVVKMIRQIFGNKINLRLDVNGKWNYKEAKTNLQELEQFDLQYVEQPVLDKLELLKFAKQSKIKIASDESIQTFDDAVEFVNSGVIDYLILKPTIRLGIFDSIRIINIARQKNIYPIITTSFETPIGRSMLVLLAGMTHHNFSHGLGLSVLGSSFANKLFDISNEEITVDTENITLNYNDIYFK